MGAMLRQFYAMFTMLFGTVERFLKSLDNLATVAEETSAQYVDDARITRKQNMIRLNKETAVLKAE